MKRRILQAEYRLLRTAPVEWLVRLVQFADFRLGWLWGRVRFGATVRNRGLGCVCAHNVELKYPRNLRLGNRVIRGSNVSIDAHSSVTLGDDVRVSRDVIIETAGLDFSNGRPPYEHISKPIVIKKGVWIGARAIILGGVTLGENVVVAA